VNNQKEGKVSVNLPLSRNQRQRITDMNVSEVVDQYISRPATWDDIPAIVDLCNVALIDQWGLPDWTVEDAEDEFSQPGYTMEQFVRMWHDANGLLVGVGMVFGLHEPPVRVRVMPYLRPHIPGYQELGLEILAWGEDVVRPLAIPRCPENAKVQMISWTYATHEPTIALYRAYGMEKVRRYLTMEIVLDQAPSAPNLPEGITIRTLRYPEEARVAYRITDKAFSDHYGHVDDPEEKNFDLWAQRFASKSFDSSLWFIVEVDGEIAGFSWCHTGMPEDPKLGWIGTLGVLPAYRRRGLAHYLLQHSFRELYAKGMHKAGLGVDATSLTGATRVYERAGMHCVAQWDTYGKVLRDGVEIVRQ
jgi:mycothiol synthase